MREMFVLERRAKILAFAASVNRGPVSFVADLFVAAAHRATGLGQHLLRHSLPHDARVGP
jgi:GNAT superfamily N-acetyltransferase